MLEGRAAFKEDVFSNRLPNRPGSLAGSDQRADQADVKYRFRRLKEHLEARSGLRGLPRDGHVP